MLRRECVNIDGTEDGYDWLAPVDSFSCGASPYGIVNLVGNVDEWVSRDGLRDPQNPLAVIRGGDVVAPAALEIATTVFMNHRSPHDIRYSIGFRCAETR